MSHQMRHWIATLDGSASPIVENWQVRAALATAIAAQQSLDTGCAVSIGEKPMTGTGSIRVGFVSGVRHAGILCGPVAFPILE